jgi:hypothetical protein
MKLQLRKCYIIREKLQDLIDQAEGEDLVKYLKVRLSLEKSMISITKTTNIQDLLCELEHAQNILEVNKANEWPYFEHQRKCNQLSDQIETLLWDTKLILPEHLFKQLDDLVLI